MLPLLSLCCVWQQVQYVPSMQLHLWHQVWHCAPHGWQDNVFQSQCSCIEASEARLPQQAAQHVISEKKQLLILFGAAVAAGVDHALE